MPMIDICVRAPSLLVCTALRHTSAACVMRAAFSWAVSPELSTPSRSSGIQNNLTRRSPDSEVDSGLGAIQIDVEVSSREHELGARRCSTSTSYDATTEASAA